MIPKYYADLSYFQHHENICGRFSKQQLNETYTIYEVSKFDHYKFVASLTLGLLTLETLKIRNRSGCSHPVPALGLYSVRPVGLWKRRFEQSQKY